MRQSQYEFQFFKHFQQKLGLKTKLKEDVLKLINSPRSLDELPPGVFFNENHRDKFPKKFLILNLQSFKDIGIETLFLEFYLYKEHQELLNDYNQSPAETELPKTLRENVEAQSQAYGHTGKDSSIYADVIIAAHKAGIRLVALDSWDAHPDYLKGINWQINREDLFNRSAAKIISAEHHNKPYIVYTGLSHGHSSLGPYHTPSISLQLQATNTYSVLLKDNPSTHFYDDRYSVDITVQSSDFEATTFIQDIESDTLINARYE